jgi:hypothetical protein
MIGTGYLKKFLPTAKSLITKSKRDEIFGFISVFADMVTGMIS